jgi:hypothetical protein
MKPNEIAYKQINSLASYIDHARLVMRDLEGNLVFEEFIKTTKQSLLDIQDTLDTPEETSSDDTQRTDIQE